MRNEYNVRRTRDGRLIVTPASPGRRIKGPLLAGLSVIAVGALISNLSPGFESLSSIPDYFRSSYSDETKVVASVERKTITVRLPIRESSNEVAPSLESLTRRVEPGTLEQKGAQRIANAVGEDTGEIVGAAGPEEVVAPADYDALQPADASGASEPTVLSIAPQALSDQPKTTVVKVKSGDSLYTIFNSLGLSQGEMLLVASGEGKQLTRIHPGQSLEFQVSDQGKLESLIYRVDEINSVHFRKTSTGYASEQIINPLDTEVATSQGHIQSSLFLSGQSAGLSDRTIMSLIEIFAWDVDFALDIRRGDQFSVVYEELFKDGAKIRDGKILAAEFVNQGRRIRAVRYTDKEGRSNYFSPDGASMRKAFLRTPVNFSRISSHFNLKRKHPVLNTIRAHKGVDYAAPRGTPIKATGDGKIAHLGRKGGYGKSIIIRHGSTYTTLYGHLNGYAKGLSAGKSVRQGQVIGYVGSTGLATGPHLHYEFRVRGVHRNPLKVELPKAAPIPEQYKQNFVQSTGALVARLDYLSGTQIASGQLASQ